MRSVSLALGFSVLAWLAVVAPARAEVPQDWPSLARETHARLATEPAQAELWNQYGYYSYRAGVTREAEPAYRESLRLNPKAAVAWNNLGVLLLNRKQLAEAEDCFRKALALLPTYSKAKYNLAVTRFKQGHYREALFMYIDVRKEDRAYVELRTNRARAEMELERAIREHPDDPFLRTVRSRYEKLKKEEQPGSPPDY